MADITREKLGALYRLEAAGKLPPDKQAALDRVRDKLPTYNLAADDPTYEYAEKQYDLPPGILRAIRGVESKGNSDAVSPTGVTGLMQVTKRTGRPFGLTAANRTNPYMSIDGAAQYVKTLMGETGGDVRKTLSRYGGPTDPQYANKVIKRWTGGDKILPSVAPQATPESTTDVTPTEIPRRMVTLPGEIIQGGEEATPEQPPTPETAAPRMVTKPGEVIGNQPVKFITPEGMRGVGPTPTPPPTEPGPGTAGMVSAQEAQAPQPPMTATPTAPPEPPTGVPADTVEYPAPPPTPNVPKLPVRARLLDTEQQIHDLEQSFNPHAGYIPADPQFGQFDQLPKQTRDRYASLLQDRAMLREEVARQEGEAQQQSPDEGFGTAVARGMRGDVQEGSWTPTIARTAGPMMGATLAAPLTPIFPLAVPFGAALGAFGGDWIAQEDEIQSGERKGYNPYRAVVETGTAGVLSKYTSGIAVTKAAIHGSLGAMASNTLISLSEGKGIPSTFEMGMSGFLGAGLGVVSSKIETNRARNWENRYRAAREMTSSGPLSKKLANFADAESALDFFHGEFYGSLRDRAKLAKMRPEEYLDEMARRGPLRPEDKVMLAELRARKASLKFGSEDTATQLELPLKPGPRQFEMLTGPERYPLELPPQGTRQMGPRGKAIAARIKASEIVHQYGFDDLEEATTFHKILTDPPQGELFADFAGRLYKSTPKRMSQGMNEDDTWNNLQFAKNARKQDLRTPLEKDRVFDDVADYIKDIPGLLRPKDIFIGIQEQTGLPVYADYEALVHAYEMYHKSKASNAVTAADALTGLDLPQRNHIMQVFADTTTVPLTPQLAKKAAQIEGVLNEALGKFGLDTNVFFKEILPAIERGDTIEQIAAKDPKNAGLMKLANYIIDGYQSARDPSLIRIVHNLIDLSHYEENLGPLSREIKAKYGNHPGVPAAAKAEINTFVDSLRGGGYDPVSLAVTRVFGFFAKKVLRQTDLTGEELANWVNRNSYGGLMGLRPKSYMRNLMQNAQTGIPIYGVKAWANGVKEGLTAKGYQLAAEKGIIDAGDLMAAERSLGRGLQKGKPLSEKVMYFHQKTEDANRVIAYTAGRKRFDAGLADVPNLGDIRSQSNWEKLLDKADIDMMSLPEQDYMHKMWTGGYSIEDMRHYYSKSIVDDTQFMYLPALRARMLQSVTGRLALGYNNWGQSYASYLARMGLNGPLNKRVGRWIRFTGTSYAIAQSWAYMGNLFGDKGSVKDQLGWTFLNPAVLKASPTVSTLGVFSDALSDVTSGKTLSSKVWEQPLHYTPGGMAGKQVIQGLMGEKSFRRKVGVGLGLSQKSPGNKY